MKHTNVFLVGLMAVGKSSVGRQLADELGYSFYDSDREIEIRAGAEIAWIFDVEGENGFRERETQVINELTLMDRIVLATGGVWSYVKKIGVYFPIEDTLPTLQAQ